MPRNPYSSRPCRGSAIWWLLALLIAPTHGTTTLAVLDPEHPVEHELAGGAEVVFVLDLPARHYVWIQVEQVGVDVAVAILDPSAVVIDEIDFERGSRRFESIEMITGNAGRYTLRLRAVDPDADPGLVRARIGDLRPARPNDPALITAERRYNEATGLERRRTPEAYARAAALHRAALDEFERANDTVGLAKTHTNLGLVLRRQGDPANAIVEYHAALPLWRQLDDARSETETLLNLAAALRGTGDLPGAIAAGETAVARARVAHPKAEPTMLDALAKTHEVSGEPDRALTLLMRALDLRQKAGDERGLARSHATLGYLYRRLGEYQRALDHLHEALAGFEPTAATRSRMIVLNNLGGVYNALGQYHRAIAFFEQARTLSRALADHDTETKVHNNMGWARHHAGNAVEAIRDFETAVAGLAPDDLSTRSEVRANLGRSLLATGDAIRARTELARARRLARGARDQRAEARAVLELGHAEATLGKPEAAVEAWRHALELARQIREPRTEAAALFALARRARDNGDLAAAQTHLETSIALFETLRANAAGDRHRATFLASKREHYSALVDLLMTRHAAEPDAGWSTAALVASERFRARSLADVLTGAIDVGHQVAPAVASRLRALDRRIRALEGQRQAADPTTTAALDAALETTMADAERLRASIRQADPELASLLRPAGSDIAAVQALLDDETGLLVIALGAERSFLWLVTPDAIHDHILPAATTLEGWAHQAHGAMIARGNRPEGETPSRRARRISDADARWRQVSTRLSEALLGPIGDQLPSRLAVVAGGALGYLPFAALPVPGGTGLGTESVRAPLLSQHELVRLPSVSVLRLLRHRAANRPPPKRTLAVVADPVFHDDDPRLGAVNVEPNASQVRNTRFERLPFAAREAEAIAGLLPDATDEQLLLATGFAATRSLVVDGRLADYRYVHFATHGIIDRQFPERSALILSMRDAAGATRDGLVRLTDLFHLRLSADLVVLSACRTALGEAIAGEGQVGLTRGFLYAGASRVVSSLWAVQDKATRTLMIRFYAPLMNENTPAADALRRAQLSMWREPRYQAPYYWAGFELQGDWR